MLPRRQVKNPHAEAEQFRRRAALGFFGVLVCLLGLGGWWWFGRGDATEASYRTATIERGDLRVSISATGSLRVAKWKYHIFYCGQIHLTTAR